MTPRFPSEFFAAQKELAQFCSAQTARASLLAAEADALRAKEGLPKELLPFLVIEESSWPDWYAFDFSSEPPTVVVWCDHAIVERWESFPAFLRWSRTSTTAATDEIKGQSLPQTDSGRKPVKYLREEI